MRVFKATYKDRKGRRRQSAKWYVEFKDHLDTVRRFPAYTDRKASEEFGRKLERLVSCRVAKLPPDAELTRWIEGLDDKARDRLTRIGLLETHRAAASKPLTKHLNDFEAALLAKGNTAKHVGLVASRARSVIGGCGFRLYSDISPGRVQAHLATLREDTENRPGISAQTFNFYLQALKQFCKWMVRDGRATVSPVDHLQGLNVRADRRHVRRALTQEEIGLLLQAARKGTEIRGWTGYDRYVLYTVALETGLRWSELYGLTRASFDLDAQPPTVTVEAAYSKHRREDVLPLRVKTASLLRDYLADRLPGADAFPRVLDKAGAKALKDHRIAMELLRPDLEVAQIPETDGSGRVVDFHALRHTFITNLANSGVHPSVAQALARHSDINLTMSRYTHTVLDRQSDAVEALPHFEEEVTAARATGTDGENVLPSCLPSQRGKHGTQRDKLRQQAEKSLQREKPRNSRLKCELGKQDKADKLVRPAGLEPAACGLGNRRSIHLSYGRL